MPSRTEDDLSAAASSTSTSQRPPESSGPSPALGWAARRFEFDPAQSEPQAGVESLQKWLLNQGATVSLDAMLGPQTLAALERAFAADEGSASVKDRLGIKDDDTLETEPPGSDTTPASDDEPASARPVALSDSAIRDVAEDRLNFRPYVEAMAEFILAEQTRPPLAIAINARWGQGKTSFMNMLDVQLKRAAADTTTRVATTWFNPWKYSEPEQVWAAFVANVTRCLRANLTRGQSWRFRWSRFREKWRRHADFAFVLHLLVALAFTILIVGIVATMSWTSFEIWASGDKTFLGALYNAVSAALETGWSYVLIGPFALLALLYVYVTFTKYLGLNLLEYVEKTDFKDKIGTLSQFEHEMARLADAVPADLKVVVFIDDLDRCHGKVLGEIIEALQLADVSRTCIFVMGMDLHIVARAIETDRSELAHSAGSAAAMEHSSGYKFLEKIIQARLTLPRHTTQQMKQLVTASMESEAASTTPAEEKPVDGSAELFRDLTTAVVSDTAAVPLPQRGLGGVVAKAVVRGAGAVAPLFVPKLEKDKPPKTTLTDSAQLVALAEHYGSRHFANPRRLKRFINGFRLQTYLTAAAQPQPTPIDRLARFLVLAEKWPAVVNYMLEREIGSQELLAEEVDVGVAMVDQIGKLPKDDKDRVYELLLGPRRGDPLTAAEWKDLADWYGFGHYGTVAGA